MKLEKSLKKFKRGYREWLRSPYFTNVINTIEKKMDITTKKEEDLMI